METDGTSKELQEWLDAISCYEREFKAWEGRSEKVLKRYRDERVRKTDSQAKFNILWSNVQTLVPATFSRLPQPNVMRRFRDNDPVGRVAALILERALDYEIQHYVDYKQTLSQMVHDRFLPGRGSCWVRYEPHMQAGDMPVNGLQITEDQDESEVNEVLDYECAPVDYVHWKDFGHNVARTWEEVTQVWRRVYLDEAAVTERFGKDIAKKVSYDKSPEEMTRAAKNGDLIKKQAMIYELWDKPQNKVVWISNGVKDVLDEREDPLGLHDFFPCPRPLYSTLTNDSLVPVPDFTLYQDQADALDILADRIAGLARMLQLKGVYDAATPELARLFTEGENGSMLAIKNYAAFSEKSGLKGTIDLVDLTQLAQAMQTAQETMAQVKDQVYEITGLSDIIRGTSDANETATAQKIKGSYASLRLKSLQAGVAEAATEILRIKAQIMCQKFSAQSLAAMGAVEQLNPEDQQYIQPALALLIGQERISDPEADSPNPLRSFRIEIAADTLVELDEQQEKKDRMEFLTANGAFMKNAVEMLSQAGPATPIITPLIMEMWKFGVTGFKVGKSVEGVFDQAADQLKQMAKQPPQPKPDPEMMKVQAKAQADQAKLQNDQQQAMQTGQLEIQRIQAESAARERELRMEAMLESHKTQMENQRAQSEMMMQAAFERFKALLDAKTKIEVAEIGAKATLDASQISAAEQGSE